MQEIVEEAEEEILNWLRGVGEPQFDSYNYFKIRPARCDVECHKRFECVFLITNWFWGRMT